MERYQHIVLCFCALLLALGIPFSSAAEQLSDHAFNIKQNGMLVNGNVTISIYNATSGLIYNETFAGAIVNGTFSVQLGLAGDLELGYGKLYSKDYLINGEDVNFTLSNGSIVNRLPFISSVGFISGLWENTSGNLTFVGGNVGIGTTAPTQKLHIQDGHLLR